MEVEYVLTVEDHVAFNRYQLASQAKPRLGMSWLWLVLLLILIGMFFLPTLSGPRKKPAREDKAGDVAGNVTLYFYIPAVAVGLLVLVWFRWYHLPLQARRVVTHPDNQKRLLGWRRAAIGPEGLAVRGEEASTTIAWSAVPKIAVTRQHAFFYITTLEAVIVPRRPFASDVGFKRFVATANEYWEQAEEAPRERKPAGREAERGMDTNITPGERGGP